MSDDVFLKSMAQWEEIIPPTAKAKVNFTVTIQNDINTKFNEIMAHYQSRFTYGKVYKHYVLQIIIDEAHTRMKKQGLI